MKTKRNQTGGQRAERVGRQEFWRWLAALALVVLVIEWLVYQRNGIAYLRQRWRAACGGGLRIEN